MPIVSFYEVKERSQRIIWLFVAGLVLYWTLGFYLPVQLGFLLYGLFSSHAELEPDVLWQGLRSLLFILPFSVTVAVVHYFWAISGIVARTLEIFSAQELDPGDPYHRLFRNTVEEISIASGNRIAIRSVVLPCASQNGFSLRTPRREAVVGITEGLLARARREEIQAVAAQLTGQILTCDALVSTLAYSLFGSLEEMVDRALEASIEMPRIKNNPAGILVVPLLAAKFFLRLGHFLNLFLSRERVFRSDAVAVELTRDPVGLALALRRLQGAWRGSGTFGDGTEAIFFVPLGRGRFDEEMGFFDFLFRCHPPLKDRLKSALGMAGTSLEDIEGLLDAPVAPRAVLGASARAAGAGGGGLSSIPGAEESWRVYHDGRWQGPFTVEDLRGLAWFGPADIVVRKGTRGVLSAREDGILREKVLSGSSGSDPCPRCGVTLREVRYEGVGVRLCASCNGKLVGEDGLHRILFRRIFPVSEGLKESMGNWKKANVARPLRKRQKDIPDRLRCPLCGDPMFRGFHSAQYFIETDRCFRCKVVWYDGGELELLQALVEDAGDRLGAEA